MVETRRERLAYLSLLLTLTASCGSHEANSTRSSRIERTPGDYVPAFEKTGFDEDDAHLGVGYAARVSHFAGSLNISNEDIRVPTVSPFAFAFRRTYTSNKVSLSGPTTLPQADSPLGLGWVAHYGVLWAAAPGQSRPEFIDGTGQRHRFFQHGTLATEIPLSSAGTRPTWISDDLTVLVSIDDDHYELYMPSGVVYEFERLPQYAFQVVTRVRDIHGNSFVISYLPDAAPYFEHPLVSSIHDDIDRAISFVYGPPEEETGKRRLAKVLLDGAEVGAYSYVYDGAWGFLSEYKTKAGLSSTYRWDFDQIPAYGTITHVTRPTGGAIQVLYEQLPVFIRNGQAAFIYAVVEVEEGRINSNGSFSGGGLTRTFEYPDAATTASANQYRVLISASDGSSRDLTFFSYGANTGCPTDAWKVGRLIQRIDRRGSSTKTVSYDYEGFAISSESRIQGCSTAVQAARMISTVEQGDGATLTQSFSDFDGFVHPRTIDGPGNRSETRDYHEVVSASPRRYLLGVEKYKEVEVGGVVVSRFSANFNSNASVPSGHDYYRTKTNVVSANLEHFTTPGKAGAIKKQSYGRYSEEFNYQNGVLSSIVYSGGRPPLSRTVNSDGTVSSETIDGVTHTMGYDSDRRLTSIGAPTGYSATAIAYGQRSASVTRGADVRTFTYDRQGRLVSRTRASGGGAATTTYANFDSEGRPTVIQVPSGATYQVAHDAFGREVTRSAPGDAHTFSYSSDSAGTTVTEVKNGAVTIVRKSDWVGRQLSGSTNGRTVTYVYSDHTKGVATTISGGGTGARTVVRDFFGQRAIEDHPESGRTSYAFSSEGWLLGVDRPGRDETFSLDDAGRVTAVTIGGVQAISRSYDPTTGQVARTATPEVVTEYLDRDGAGLPHRVRTTIQAAVPFVEVVFPPMPPISPLIPPPGSSSYRDEFVWLATPGAVRYQIIGREDATGMGDYVEIFRTTTSNTKLSFSDVGFLPVNGSIYRFEIRALTDDGRVGAFTYVPFHINPFYNAQANAGVIDPDGDPIFELIDIGPEEPASPQNFHAASYDIMLEYDALGYLSGVQHPKLSRPVSWIGASPTAGDSVWQMYTNSPLGRASTVKYGGWSVVSSTAFDATGRMTAATIPILGGGLQTTMNALTVSSSYDELGRRKSLTIADGEGTSLYLADSMHYDAFGHLKGYQRNDPGMVTEVGFSYDGAGRIDTWTIGGQVVDYGLDASGNLTSRTAFSVSTGGSAGGRIEGQAVSASVDASTNRLSSAGYGPDGELISDGRHSYEYGPLGRVVHVTDAQGWRVASFTYDAFGRRVREISGRTIEVLLRLPDGRLVTREIMNQGSQYAGFPLYYKSIRVDSIHHDGKQLARIYNGRRVDYELRDRQGNAALTYRESSSGSIVDYWEMSPFGEQVLRPVGSRRTPMANFFTGHLRDSSTGFDDMSVRFYDTVAGRFTRPDPAFDFDANNGATLNLYGYARSSPNNYVDPDGLAPATIWRTAFRIPKKGIKPGRVLSRAEAKKHMMMGEDVVTNNLSDGMKLASEVSKDLGGAGRAMQHRPHKAGEVHHIHPVKKQLGTVQTKFDIHLFVLPDLTLDMMIQIPFLDLNWPAIFGWDRLGKRAYGRDLYL